MSGRIKTLLFGKEHECQAAAEILTDLEIVPKHKHEYCQVNDLEEFERALADWEPSLLVVLADGAKGMECVYQSRERRPNLPVFWFSNDQGFGILSYRLNCAYFSTKPATQEKISHAFLRCHHIGIQYQTM